MKNNETLADILFPKARIKSANIIVDVGNPNPFLTGRWVCPSCGHIFTHAVTLPEFIDVCPVCRKMIEFNLSHRYMDSELERYSQQAGDVTRIATPNELRTEILDDSDRLRTYYQEMMAALAQQALAESDQPTSDEEDL